MINPCTYTKQRMDSNFKHLKSHIGMSHIPSKMFAIIYTINGLEFFT